MVDAPTTPPPAYPIVLHFDANSGECGFWRGLHGATFTPIQNGSQGAGCTICGLGRDPTDGVPPFLRLSLVPEVGTYTFTGSFKLGEKPASVLSKLQIGFQISSESAPGQSALPGALQPVSPTDSWTPSMVVVPLTTLTAPDQSRVVLDATIELDPPSSGVSDECFDVDEITISFTPSQ